MAAFCVVCATTARAVSAYAANLIGQGVTALSSTRYPNKQNASKQPSKPSQASQGPLGAAQAGVRLSTRVSDLAKRKTRLRGVALHIAPPPDHSDQRIDPDARESHSKPRVRAIFSSPLLTCFALARARSGPDARDGGAPARQPCQETPGSLSNSDTQPRQKYAFPTSYVNAR